MQFTSARAIEQVVWQMRLADYPRDVNRALINSLANGAPPYSKDEEAANRIVVNVNDLTLTRLSHEARSQLYQGFNKPGNFFTARTDGGAVTKRMERGYLATKEATRIMKRSDLYYECMRSKFALTVLHGIGPGNWESEDRWCPIPLGVEDVLMPSNTLLTFRNLPFFAIFRPYTAGELTRLIRDEDRAEEAGWNIPVAKQAIKWADEQTAKLYSGSSWQQYWSPSKREERVKQDAGIYASDLVQTIDCLDFYFWDNIGRHEGWRRRIVFDAWGGYSAWQGPTGYGAREEMPTKNLLGEDKGQFLFSSGRRAVADRLSSIIHFQLADLSAVAPFRYHSIRSLGFLLYAVCHLQNRLRCSFSEAVFETLLNYMRVRSLDEAERVLKISLANRGIIDESVEFLPPNQRWQPNAQLAELGLNEFKQIISDNSASYVQNQNLSRDRVEKTKFQVMAEVNAMQTLVSSALQQAYRYQASEYREIFRRLLKKNSCDPDANEFRARCLSGGIPERLLVPDAWDIEPERVVGGGNKTLEMAIAQQLMEWRTAYSPEAQQQILRKATLAITDDAAEAEALVPSSPGVSNTRHDTMLSFGSLMAGGQVLYTADQNRLEVAQTLLGELGLSVAEATKMGNMVSVDRVMGYRNVLKSVANLIAEIAKDPTQKEAAKQLSQASGQIANLVKGFAQRLKTKLEAEAKQQGANGEAAALKAKLASQVITAQAKAANTRESHAQRTAQKQVSFEQQQEQNAEDHRLEMQRKMDEQRMDNVAKGMETVASIRRGDLEASASEESSSEE